MNDENSAILLTPSAVLSVLLQMEELSGYDIDISYDGGLVCIKVGDSIYELSDSDIVDVPVDDEAIDIVSDVNDATYEELDDGAAYEPVASGVISEVLKTLLVGGLVRLTKKIMN